MFASSLFKLFGGLSKRTTGERQKDRVRTAMLALLQGHEGQIFHRVAQRVRFADDLEALWYLRQDMMTALSEVHGEMAARREMHQINGLFKGCLPQTMVPRVHQRFNA